MTHERDEQMIDRETEAKKAVDPLPWLEDCNLPEGAIIPIGENDKTPIVPGMILGLKDELFLNAKRVELAQTHKAGMELPSVWEANPFAPNYVPLRGPKGEDDDYDTAAPSPIFRDSQHDWHAQSPKEKARHFWMVLSVTNEDTSGDQGIVVAAVTVQKNTLRLAPYEQFVLSVHRANERNHGKALPSFYFESIINIRALEKAGYETSKLLDQFEHNPRIKKLSVFVRFQRWQAFTATQKQVNKQS
jgi:hypothetical protein